MDRLDSHWVVHVVCPDWHLSQAIHMKNFIKPGSRLRPFANVLLSAVCLLCVYALPVPPAHAQQKRIYQTDQYGNAQYHKLGYAIQSDGRIIETDSGGNKQYHKQQYKIKDGTVYQAGSDGSIQYHKTSLGIQADGLLFPKDRYGNTLYSKDHFVQKDDKIYRTDRFGIIQYQKPGFRVVSPK